MYPFQKIPYKKKNGQIVERLKAVKENVNITFIIEFIDNILAKMLHHCNHLQHFHNVHSTFQDLFDCVWIDVNFSENLPVLVK